MKLIQNKTFIFLAIIVLAIAGFLIIESYPRDKTSLVIGGHKIIVEIADTDEKRYQGLSNRENLCPDCGMLFVWPEKAERAFVMRDMKIKLDIIWINNGKVVKIDENLAPEGSLPINLYKSPGPVDYVLEVNAGFTKKNNIKVNDPVKINLP